MVANRDIIAYMQNAEAGAGLIDRMKIRYRPLICPFAPLLEHVRDGDCVADIGCGSGQLSLLVQRFTGASRIMGLEISDTLIGNANALFRDQAVNIPYEFLTYDGTSFPDELANANALFLVDVLHHIPIAQQQQFLCSLHDVMQPGARLLLKDIDAASKLVVFNKMHDLVFSREIGWERSLQDVIDMAKHAGFSIKGHTSITVAVYPHFFLELERPHRQQTNERQHE